MTNETDPDRWRRLEEAYGRVLDAAPHDRAQVLGGRDPAAQGFPQAIDGAADKLKTAIESTLGRLRNY